MERSDFYSFEHYEYGEPYLGSCKGVRFRLAMEPLKNPVVDLKKHPEKA